MSDIEVKSTATLIDELITTNLKIFWALEKSNETDDELEVGKQYGMAQSLNSRRSKLMAAIDRRLGESDTAHMEKTF